MLHGFFQIFSQIGDNLCVVLICSCLFGEAPSIRQIAFMPVLSTMVPWKALSSEGVKQVSQFFFDLILR